MKTMPEIDVYFIDTHEDKIVAKYRVKANAPLQALKRSMEEFRKDRQPSQALCRIVMDLVLEGKPGGPEPDVVQQDDPAPIKKRRGRKPKVAVDAQPDNAPTQIQEEEEQTVTVAETDQPEQQIEEAA